MTQESAPKYDQEKAAFAPRETALSAVLAFAPQRVFNALEQAAERQGLKSLMSSAANGLLVTRPPLSLLNLGRRVTVTVSPGEAAGTATVRARYTHGLVSFEDRYARLSLLNELFRNALLQLEAGDAAREATSRRPPEPPPGKPAEPPAAPPAYPTLNELRAKVRAAELARRGLPPDTPGAEEFLTEKPEGFHLPAKFKARRVFWFALGVVLAVVLMALLSLSSR